MDDFEEFVEFVMDDHIYLPIPKSYIRDMENPLERYCNDELLQRFRFCRRTITDILLPLIYPNYNIEDHRGLPIPPIIKLCISLRYYASGSYQRICGDLHGISQSSASRIIKEVSDLLASKLCQFIKFPRGTECIRNKNLFYNIARFPGVVGCIDGTHVEIRNPGGERGEIFRNKKTWFSLNLQVVSGPDAKILDIVIRWPGSTHDSRIFHNSAVKLRFEQEELRGILLGDNDYPQTRYLFTPLLNPETRAERRYNVAHKSTRNVVERCFGQWKQRFLVLTHMMCYKLRTTIRIIAATAVLHNIAIEQKEQFIPVENFFDRNVPVAPIPENSRGNQIRATFIRRHFNN